MKSIIRDKFSPNVVMEDKSLSLEARGLYFYICCSKELPGDKGGIINIDFLKEKFPLSDIEKISEELSKAGLIKLEIQREVL